jgi:hypothetical protein
MRPADTTPASAFAYKPRKLAKSSTLCKGSVAPAFQTATSSDSLHERASSFTQAATVPTGYLYSALLVDDDAAHAEQLINRVQTKSLAVERFRSPEEAMVKLRSRSDCYELVIVNISANGPPWHRILRTLQHACHRLSGQGAPSFLCVSKTRKDPAFILRIEHLGARYVFER